MHLELACGLMPADVKEEQVSIKLDPQGDVSGDRLKSSAKCKRRGISTSHDYIIRL